MDLQDFQLNISEIQLSCMVINKKRDAGLCTSLKIKMAAAFTLSLNGHIYFIMSTERPPYKPDYAMETATVSAQFIK